VAVDHGDVDISLLEPARRLQATEPAADDHHPAAAPGRSVTKHVPSPLWTTIKVSARPDGGPGGGRWRLATKRGEFALRLRIGEDRTVSHEAGT